MGIFTSSTGLRAYVEDAEVELPLPDEAIDNHEEIEDAHTGEIDPDPVVDPVEESYHIYAESEYNFNNLMMAVGLSELRSYQESGVDYIHEAPDIRAFWEKVKKFFKTLKEKIWAVVKNFIARIQVRFQNGAKFVAKYSAQIKAGYNKIKSKGEDLKIRGYKFTNTDWNLNFKSEKAAAVAFASMKGDFSEFDAKKFMEYAKNNQDKLDIPDDSETEKALDLIRGGTVGKSSCSADEFDNELFEYFHGGDTDKTALDISDINIEQVLKVLKSGSQYIGKMKKNYREIERKCTECIKKANEFESKFASVKHDDGDNEIHGKALSFINAAIKMTKDIINIHNRANSAHLAAVKGELAQSRKIALRCIQGDNKVDKKLFGESYSMSGMSMIDNVSFK